jgi:hypothetical protein
VKEVSWGILENFAKVTKLAKDAAESKKSTNTATHQ